MKVRELIAELVRHDMEEDIFVGLGPDTIPSGNSAVHSIRDYSCVLPGGADCTFGVYIIPKLHLEKVDFND